MERWLTYDQISLIPTQVSNLEHRAEADTSVKFGNLILRLPILAAPMPDVCNREMAIKLAWHGASGIVHRFQPVENQQIWTSSSLNSGAAVGISENYMARAKELIDGEFGYICIDTANGASERVREAISRLKDKWPDLFIVTGNVASAEAFQALENWGADAIRVGIAGGSVCETRTETGVYSPMASVIMDVNPRYEALDLTPGSINFFQQPSGIPWNYYIPYQRKALLIADGGIRTPADMCKALALGADVVMMGGALAGTKEAPGDVIKLDGKLYKKLRGAASFGVQKETNEKDPDYVEGAETLVPYVGSVEKVIHRFAAGLRSSMSYMNARDLTEYRRNVKIVEIG